MRLHRGRRHGRLPRHRRRRGHRGGRRARARRRAVRCAGGRPLRAPARASGDGVRRAGRQAGRVGRRRQHAAQFRRAVGRRATVCTPGASGSARAARLNPLALLASAGVPLAFGSDTPVTSMNPWATVRAASHHHTPGSAISARAAFAAATRGAWRAGGVRDGVTGTLVPGAPASYAVWETGELGRERARRQRAALVHRSAVAGARPAAARSRRPAAALPADRAPGCRLHG